MRGFADIRLFTKENSEYELRLLGLKRRMPLYHVSSGLYVAANEHVAFGCDVDFTKRVARELVLRIKKYNPDYIIAAEAKVISLAYEVAQGLGHKGYAIARKGVKENIEGYIFAKTSSITSKNPTRLVLSKYHARKIRNKRVVLIDDVVSTGSTMQGLLSLVKRANADAKAIACIWLEGPWPFKMYKKEIESGKLLYLDVLPVFASECQYKRLMAQEYPGVEKFVQCLGVKKKEKVLILTDKASCRQSLNMLADRCRCAGARTEVDSTLPTKVSDDIPKRLRRKLKGFDVIILAASVSWYHASFRRDLKYKYKKRVVECYALCPDIFKDGALTADFNLVSEINKGLNKKLKGKKRIKITSSRGTDIRADIRALGYETGIYTKPLSGGNLPAGEISIGVFEKSSFGKVIFDLNLDGIGALNGKTVELTIRNGRITGVSGKPAPKLRKLLAADSRLKNVAEIGIGTNPFSITGRTILEDEKTLGTVHIGIGSDSVFGGRTKGPHYDGVLKEPTIDVDDVRIMSRGRFSKHIFSKTLNRRLKSLRAVR